MNETNGSNETAATNEAPAPDPLQGARVVEVIEVMCNRGEGTDRDPVRRVPRYFSKRGDLLAENDGWHERRRMSEALLKIADLEARGDALVESLRARNRELEAEGRPMTATIDDVVAQLRRGACSDAKRHEAPCATCDAVDERIALVLSLRSRLEAAELLRGEVARERAAHEETRRERRSPGDGARNAGWDAADRERAAHEDTRRKLATLVDAARRCRFVNHHGATMLTTETCSAGCATCDAYAALDAAGRT